MHIELVITKLVTMVLGIAIAYQAYRGYRRNHTLPMLYVALGFLLVSVGAILDGVLFDVAGLSLVDAGTIQTGIVAVGMLTILYALYGGKRPAAHER